MKFKVGQKVYFYQETGPYMGTIFNCKIIKATKDLSTGKITYQLDTKDIWLWSDVKELTGEYLYTSYKKIQKEYKEEIIYNSFREQMSRLEDILYQVRNELQKEEHKNLEGLTLNIDNNMTWSKIYVDPKNIMIGDISVEEEINKIKKEINKIKNKIKPKTKKPVVKKVEKTEEKTEKTVETTMDSNV